MSQVAHQTPLVVIGGWGVDAAMLLPLFDNWPGEIHMVSLNDSIMTRCGSISAVAAYLLDRYPCPAVWAGWSQGAQVAMAAASQSAVQVSRLITLAGFPRFLASPDWPVGMAANTFNRFRADVASEATAPQAWRRFQQLLIHGCDDRLQARKDLVPWLEQGASVAPANLIRGLDWLEMEDQLGLWQQVRVPTLHLQAEHDAIVRSWVETFIPSETSETVSIPGMTHWPRGHAARLCRAAIRRFVFCKGNSWLI